MTPKELNLVIESRIEDQKQQQKDKIALEWINAMWQRSKRMPSFDKIIKSDTPKRDMSPEEMLLKVKQMNAAYGGTTY